MNINHIYKKVVIHFGSLDQSILELGGHEQEQGAGKGRLG